MVWGPREATNGVSRIDSADALVQRGDQLLAAGALDAAARLYQQAIDHDGRHAEALRSLAFVLLERGEAAAALGPAERAVTEQPDLEGARGLLGNVLMALDRHAEAIPHLIFDEDREHGMTQMMRRGQVGMCYE